MTDEELIRRLCFAPLSCLDDMGWIDLRRLIDTAAERIHEFIAFKKQWALYRGDLASLSIEVDTFREESLELQEVCQARFIVIQELEEKVRSLQEQLEGKQ